MEAASARKSMPSCQEDHRLVYREDPFGNIIEAFSHSYAETFANMPGWKAIDA